MFKLPHEEDLYYDFDPLKQEKPDQSTVNIT
jgi:hypothetical protein